MSVSLQSWYNMLFDWVDSNIYCKIDKLLHIMLNVSMLYTLSAGTVDFFLFSYFICTLLRNTLVL